MANRFAVEVGTIMLVSDRPVTAEGRAKALETFSTVLRHRVNDVLTLEYRLDKITPRPPSK